MQLTGKVKKLPPQKKESHLINGEIAPIETHVLDNGEALFVNKQETQHSRSKAQGFESTIKTHSTLSSQFTGPMNAVYRKEQFSPQMTQEINKSPVVKTTQKGKLQTFYQSTKQQNKLSKIVESKE